jgi:hypothetical protein
MEIKKMNGCLIMQTKKIFGIIFLVVLSFQAFSQNYTLKNNKIEVSVDKNGNLTALKNLQTGANYASGKPMWRLYFDTKEEKGNEVLAKENTPVIRQDGDHIYFAYNGLNTAKGMLDFQLSFTVSLEEEMVRFGSEITNNEPHTIIRELQYPLVGNCRLPVGHKLLTTYRGGQLFSNPKRQIMEVGNNPPYMAPSQYYRQMDLKYPSETVSNCFSFTGDDQGLYFGSHDTTFQDTWHGLRLYPDKDGEFEELEAGLYKYPNCMEGESWKCNANVIVPYSGDWHQTSKIYRKWANTWWSHREAPLWVQKMNGWQRIIFRHQYGETFFRYADLGGRIKNVGESAGINTVLAFAWWNSGMDNGYPDSYDVTDEKQGGDEAWKKAIDDFRKDGGKLLLYFNGKLIDTESDYYKNGNGKQVCYRMNTGTEYTESYRFKAMDTFTGHHNARSFVVADTRNAEWQQKLLKMADRAIWFGADAVFYDQLGYCEPVTNWDLSKEFPIPDTRVMANKARMLKMLHDYIDTKEDKNFAIGTEHLCDVTAQHVDFVHNITGATSPVSFTDWARYTFPEVILSDREIRDDTDVERRVNHAVLKCLRNDVEIYRCRDLIDKTPNYRQYLAKVNKLKDQYSYLLLEGKYCDTDYFSVSNKDIQARSFVHGNRMAIVLTQSTKDVTSARVRVPEYIYKESSGIGNVKIDSGISGPSGVTIGKNGLVVLIFEK